MPVLSCLYILCIPFLLLYFLTLLKAVRESASATQCSSPCSADSAEMSTERGLTLQGMSFGVETDADDFFITHKLMTINGSKVKLAVLQFKQMDFEAHNLRLSWMCRLRAILVIK